MWQLGAPTVSLMAGLRLVSAIVLSRLILGTSAVQTGVQVGGWGAKPEHGLTARALSGECTVACGTAGMQMWCQACAHASGMLVDMQAAPA